MPHEMALVENRTQELGVKVKHIPMCQPIDVGFNKPFKDSVWRQWMLWMISKGIIHGTTSPPTRHDIGAWLDRVMAEMKREQGIVRNVWLKTGFQLVPEGGASDVGGGVRGSFSSKKV
jgi:hypothetical protein